MRFMKSIPDYAKNLNGAKNALDYAKELWNGGNVLAGRRDGAHTYFKEPYGIIATGLAFNVAYVMLVLGTLQKWVEIPLIIAGKIFIRLIRFIFAVVMLAISSPVFLVAFAVNVKTGQNTKFGNKITVLENDKKNSDKA